MIRGTASGKMHIHLAQACQKYGGLVRIGPNDVLTDDAKTLRLIDGLRNPFQRSDWCNARGTILIPGYPGRELGNLEGDMVDRILAFCEFIRKKYLPMLTISAW